MLFRDSLAYIHPTITATSIIRLVPALSTAALKSKLDKELAMWYCLRAINHWGNGHLDLEYSVEQLTDNFRYSRSTACRIIESGDGVFWDKKRFKNFNRLQIKIYGLRKLFEYFDIPRDRYFIEIPVEEFVGRSGTRAQRQRAWLYASFHKPQGMKSTPISRASVTEATSVNRRSQQRYDKQTSIRIANYADRQDASGKMVPITDIVDGKNRRWPVHKQLGNTYHCRANRGPRGMLRKVKGASRQSCERGEACRKKRFFSTVRSYLKYPWKHEDPYLMVLPKGGVMTRGVEWCQLNP
ncbi:hypothetical protein ACFLV5_05185 [Chloroflexota bacterium]